MVVLVHLGFGNKTKNPHQASEAGVNPCFPGRIPTPGGRLPAFHCFSSPVSPTWKARLIWLRRSLFSPSLRSQWPSVCGGLRSPEASCCGISIRRRPPVVGPVFGESAILHRWRCDDRRWVEGNRSFGRWVRRKGIGSGENLECRCRRHLGMDRRKRPKEEIAEDYCFVCKEGGRLLLCEYGDCLKAYHPECVGKDDSFLETGEYWTCSWHTCFICHKSSEFQCFCCPNSVCRACIRATEFVQLRKTKGFCCDCLKLLMLAEENADVDSEGGRLNFRDTETNEFLFKDYWDIIKEQEKLSMKDLHEAENLLKKGENYKNDHESGQNFEEEGELTSDVECIGSAFDESMPLLEYKVFGNRKDSVKRLRSKKKDFKGWGSIELVDFLSSLGKDTTEPLKQWDVCEIIKKYVHDNNLLHPNRKKKTVVCDVRLRSLFRKKSVKLLKIYSLLEGHFAANADSDDSTFGSEEDSDLVIRKKFKRTNSDAERMNKRENVYVPPAGCNASVIDKNIKLVYLRRSLIKEFLKNPESLEGKLVGCFVRIKSDPKDFDFSPNRLYMLRQVSGIKKVPEVYMIGEMSTDIVLRVSNVWKDVQISMLSDDDFEEEECEDLRQLVKKGLFRRPSVVEFQEKVRSIHEDIMTHWIKREIAILQRQIDRANEKGWSREKCEYIERRALLQTHSEQLRLLKEIPKVIPDIQDLGVLPNSQLNSQKENKGKKTGISEDAVETKAEGEKTGLSENAVETKAKEEEQHKPTDTKTSCKGTVVITIDEDDEPPEVMADALQMTSTLWKRPGAFGENEEVWYYLDPSGKEQGPFAMSFLRHWKNAGFFDDAFRVWNLGQTQKDGILLNEALLLTDIEN